MPSLSAELDPPDDYWMSDEAINMIREDRLLIEQFNGVMRENNVDLEYTVSWLDSQEDCISCRLLGIGFDEEFTFDRPVNLMDLAEPIDAIVEKWAAAREQLARESSDVPAS